MEECETDVGCSRMVTQSVWNLITNFGDGAVGLPLALLVLIVLLASGWSRGAAGWIASVGACLLVVATLKFAFDGCGSILPAAHHFSPSGHAALSAVTYGGLALLGSRHLPELARPFIAVAASAWVCAIAASRIELHVHSPVEVVVGLAIGGASVALLAAVIGRSAGPRWLAPALAGTTVAVLVVMHGARWPLEDYVHVAAVGPQGSARLCGR